MMCYRVSITEYGIIIKHVYSSLYLCPICKDYVIMEYAVHLNMESSQK